MTVMPGSDEILARQIIQLLKNHGLVLGSHVTLHVDTDLPPSEPYETPVSTKESYVERIASIQRQTQERYDKRDGKSPKPTSQPQKKTPVVVRNVHNGETALAIPHSLEPSQIGSFIDELQNSLREVHRIFEARYAPTTQTIYIVGRNPKPRRIINKVHEFLRE